MARLSSQALAQAAGYFGEAISSGHTLAPFPDELAPRTSAQAARILALVLADLGLPNVGVRLAPLPGHLTGPASAGPVLGPRLLHAPAVPPPLNHPVATAALVAQLAKTLPARERAWSAREVIARIATLHVALDVAASRFTDGAPDFACHIADLGGLGAIILGKPARAGWQEALAGPRKATAKIGHAALWQGPIDARAGLVAGAEAARALGGLPAGAVLVIAGLSPPLELPEGGAALTLSITGLGKTVVESAA